MTTTQQNDYNVTKKPKRKQKVQHNTKEIMEMQIKYFIKTCVAQNVEEGDEEAEAHRKS